MTSEIYFFEKTKEDRLRDLRSIFNITKKPIPPSEIKHEWSFFLQEVVDPMGWNAVWYVSRQECEELALHFPTILLVVVEDIDFKNLTAFVEVVAVKDEAVIDKKHIASLKQLYPTITQDEMIAMNIERTAYYLEQFRFFFDYVWMPWDEDSDEKDWPTMHLESRLDLYYDLMLDGKRSMAGYVKTLLQEGKEVHQKILSLQKAIEDEGREEEVTSAMDQSRVEALMEMHVRQEQIKGEMECLESPVLRTLIVKKQQKKMRTNEILCVCEVATANEIIELLTVIKSQIEPSAAIKMLPSLQEALNQSKCGQQIFVCPGIHSIKKSSNVEVEHIKGVGGPGVTTLTSQCGGSCLLQVWTRQVTLENLTLDASVVQMALAVGGGLLKLRNCSVVGSDRSNRTEGIVVLKGGRLQASNCKFTSFGTAISVKAGADIALESCTISDCHVGILMCEDANVLLVKTLLTGSKDCGIKIETTKVTSRYGNIDLLESFSGVKMQECVISESAKGDVQLVQQPSCLLYDSTDSGCSFTEL